MASEWMTDNPKDRAFIAYAGDLAVTIGDFPSTEKYFRELLVMEPQNAAALNNVAWAMAKQHKPGAVEFAERAVKLRPNAAGLLDTLALALVEAGQHDRALEQQKRALAITPNDSGLRLNLAKIYARKGSKEAARAELEALIKLGDKFPAAAEVKELLKAM